MSNLVNHAQHELELAGLLSEESDYHGKLGKAVLDLVKVFAEQGHSGMSATMAVGLFEKLARFDPLSPLTGADDEWNDVGDGLLQNKRCSRVFKDCNGYSYDVEGRIFRDLDGLCFTNGRSHVKVTFPYTPVREYVDVPA